MHFPFLWKLICGEELMRHYSTQSVSAVCVCVCVVVISSHCSCGLAQLLEINLAQRQT